MNSWQINLKDPGQIVEGAEDIAQCVYLILATAKGSDPLRPQFGSDLYKYLDKPLAENKPALIYCITQAIGRWEKRIRLIRCEVRTDRVATLTVTLYAELRSTKEQTTITLNIEK